VLSVATAVLVFISFHLLTNRLNACVVESTVTVSYWSDAATDAAADDDDARSDSMRARC